jgi:hypothetical protein
MKNIFDNLRSEKKLFWFVSIPGTVTAKFKPENSRNFFSVGLEMPDSGKSLPV